MSVNLVKPIDDTGCESGVTTLVPYETLASSSAENPSALATCGQGQSVYVQGSPNMVMSQFKNLQSGIQISLQDGCVLMNSVNVTTFIETCRSNPTPKAKSFLNGMLARLASALPHQNNSSVRAAVLQLMDAGSLLART